MKLLYFKEVLWLSSGQARIRFLELKEQFYMFVLQKYWCSKFADLFWNGKCLLEGCTQQIFQKYIHLSFQGKGDILTKARNSFFLRNYVEYILKTDVWQCFYPYVILVPKDVKVSFIKTLISVCQQFSNCGPRTFKGPQDPFSGSTSLKPFS